MIWVAGTTLPLKGFCATLKASAPVETVAIDLCRNDYREIRLLNIEPQHSFSKLALLHYTILVATLQCFTRRLARLNFLQACLNRLWMGSRIHIRCKTSLFGLEEHTPFCSADCVHFWACQSSWAPFHPFELTANIRCRRIFLCLSSKKSSLVASLKRCRRCSKMRFYRICSFEGDSSHLFECREAANSLPSLSLSLKRGRIRVPFVLPAISDFRAA